MRDRLSNPTTTVLRPETSPPPRTTAQFRSPRILPRRLSRFSRGDTISTFDVAKSAYRQRFERLSLRLNRAAHPHRAQWRSAKLNRDQGSRQGGDHGIRNDSGGTIIGNIGFGGVTPGFVIHAEKYVDISLMQAGRELAFSTCAVANTPVRTLKPSPHQRNSPLRALGRVMTPRCRGGSQH